MANNQLLNERTDFASSITIHDPTVKDYAAFTELVNRLGSILYFTQEFTVETEDSEKICSEKAFHLENVTTKEASQNKLIDINITTNNINYENNHSNKCLNKKFVFVFYNAPKAQSDGILKILKIWNNEPGIAQNLIRLIEKYQWREFSNSCLFREKFNNSFDDYLSQFANIGCGTNLVMESKNNSNVYYLIFQLDRALNDFEDILKKGKDTVAICFLNFSEECKETLNENTQWLKNLEILINNGSKIIMLNIIKDEFEGVNMKDQEVTEKMWEEIKNMSILKHPKNECVPLDVFNKVLKRLENLEREVQSLRKENKQLKKMLNIYKMRSNRNNIKILSQKRKGPILKQDAEFDN